MTKQNAPETLVSIYLDDEDTERQAADQAVPTGKVRGERWCSRWKLADEGAGCRNVGGEFGMPVRVGAIEPTGTDGDGLSACEQCSAMSGGIDAEREPARDDETQ